MENKAKDAIKIFFDRIKQFIFCFFLSVFIWNNNFEFIQMGILFKY